MSKVYDTDQDLLDAGFLALREALGPEAAFRFVRILKPGAGDYTQERVLHTGEPTIDELLEQIEEMRQDERWTPAVPEQATAG